MHIYMCVFYITIYIYNDIIWHFPLDLQRPSQLLSPIFLPLRPAQLKHEIQVDLQLHAQGLAKPLVLWRAGRTR